MTINISKPNIKLPSKRILLTVAGVLAVLVLLGASLAVYQRHQVLKAQEAAVAQDKAVAAETARTNQVKALQDEVTASKQTNAQICEWVRGVQAQRRQAVPVLCVVKQ